MSRPSSLGPDSVSIEEGSTNLVVGIYTATDQDGDNIAWQLLDGADANRFRLTSTASNGTLALRAIPNFESPTDSGEDNIYNVRLAVRAGNDTVWQAVVVTVTNKEEPGMLTLPATRPQAEADYTATLNDPDVVQSPTWTWERSMSRSGSWEPVTGDHPRRHSTTSVYRPVAGDVDYYLRVTAAYTDALSPPGKSLVALSTNSVLAAPGSNTPPAFAEMNPARSVAENAGARALVGGPVRANDPDPGQHGEVRVRPGRSARFGPVHD